MDIDVTPERIKELIQENNHSLALSYAFRLNEKDYILRAIENIPIEDGRFYQYRYLTACRQSYLSILCSNLERKSNI